MSNTWFRSHHGAPTDNKWLLIGRKAGVAPGIVSAIVWALFDHASQDEQRGSVVDFDIETYSTFSGFAEDDIKAVINALTDKGIIAEGKLTNWKKRQPDKEDIGATERKRLQREREALAAEREEIQRLKDEVKSHSLSQDVTPCHAMSQDVTIEQNRQEQIRIDNIVLPTSQEERGNQELSTDLSTISVDELDKELDLNDLFICVDVVCSLFGKKSLTQKEQETLAEWCGKYDIRHFVLPLIEKGLNDFRNKNNGNNPNSVAYFVAMLEGAAKSRAP